MTNDDPPRSPTTPRRERSDARRDRERLLTAARDVFVERGLDAPLEKVARRAGVGIGTLYRRFPDRSALMRAGLLTPIAVAAPAAAWCIPAGRFSGLVAAGVAGVRLATRHRP